MNAVTHYGAYKTLNSITYICDSSFYHGYNSFRDHVLIGMLGRRDNDFYPL